METILKSRIVYSLNFTIKARLTAAGMAAVLTPLLMAQAERLIVVPPGPHFGAASVKPVNEAGGGREGPRAGSALQFQSGRVFSYPEGVTARRIIMDAYGLQPQQISGGPTWLDSDNFYIDAKAADPSAGKDQLRLMLQLVLAERFKLVMSRGSRIMPVYALVAAKNGPTLHEIKEGEVIPPTGKELIALGLMPPMRPGERAAGVMRADDTMDEFAAELSIYPKLDDRPVLNKTGLRGTYLIAITWYADGDITTAIQQMLGLKLESQKDSVEIVTIGHIEKPDPN